MDKVELLAPGPEMDAEVGKLIGATPEIKWYVMNKEETAYCIDFERESTADNWLSDMVTRFPDSFYAQDGYHVVRWEIYPRYSEDISEAWKVVRWLKPNYWVETSESRRGAACRVGEYGSNDAFAVGRGKEAPEAICRLALIMDAKKGSALTEAQGKISHPKCSIDLSKIESLVDRVWAEEVLEKEEILRNKECAGNA